jgi:catechol 2,3-dioxygenase-like lactoylglutathione lyase family enzyme
MTDEADGRAGPRPAVPYWHLHVDQDGVSHQTRCALTDYELKGVGPADPQWNDKMERGEATVVFTVQPVGWVGDLGPLVGRIDGWRPGRTGTGGILVRRRPGLHRNWRQEGAQIGRCRRSALLPDDRTTACRSEARAMSPNLKFDAIAGFRLVTAAPEGLAEFYRALGFELGETTAISVEEMAVLGLQGGGLRRTMTLGASRLDLDGFDRPGRAYPVGATACDPIFQHLALVTDDIEAAWRLAGETGAPPISRGGPVRLPRSAGGVTAVKFRDPEGHPLEFLQFPPGANPDWSGVGVMGIDHSAICVADVVASGRFYTGHGLCQGQRSLNHGPTQAALDGLDNVEVDVVPMNPSKRPPHVELLGYRHPPVTASKALDANDIAATRIVWRADHEALLRDPDGHLHQFTQ